jgi:hypothetical protein
VVCTGLGVGLGDGAGGVAGGASDCEGAEPAAAAGLWWRWCRCRCTDGLGLGDGDGDGDGLAEGVAATFGGVWPVTVAAGAVRANTTANPTVASAPSCVARQVSRDRRRSPRVRPCPAGSSSYGARTGRITAWRLLSHGEEPFKRPLPLLAKMALAAVIRTTHILNQ